MLLMVLKCIKMGYSHHTSGETADVGDLVRTLMLDNTIDTRIHKGYC